VNRVLKSPQTEKILRYSAAYACFVAAALLNLALSWVMHSNILVLAAGVLQAPIWLSNFIDRWGIFFVLIPYILSIGVIEAYLNGAARLRLLRPRLLKLLQIEGWLSLAVLGLMEILALLGYPPTF